LYVHTPFCVVKCSYCDFYSVVADGQDADGTVEALLAEAARVAPREPRTVFLGGGTPSWLSIPQLERLLDGLDELTGFRRAAEEVTLEANPESLDAAKAERLRELGVDRLSIGVQSLRPELLRLFERPHDADEGPAAFERARRAGFERISMDLIYAAPGQDLAAWEEDLERVLALGPEHVSAYALAFEEGTRLARALADGRLAEPDEELALAFFRRTRARLAAAGLEAYEVSNFALEGAQCRHNVNYWRNGDYAGIGPSAVSSVAGARFGNPRSLAAWTASVGRGESGAAWSERLAPPARLAETWWLGLRLAEGVDPAAARARAGGGAGGIAEADDPTTPLVRELLEDGWLRRGEGPRVALSERGLPVADAIASRFLRLAPSRSGAPGRSTPAGATSLSDAEGAARPA